MDIKNQGLPTVYTTNKEEQNKKAQQDSLTDLQTGFAKLLKELDTIWNNGQDISDDGNFWDFMCNLLPKATTCWQTGVIPNWSK